MDSKIVSKEKNHIVKVGTVQALFERFTYKGRIKARYVCNS